MIEKVHRMGCPPSIKVEVPEEIFISDFDLNILLSNLLENSIEAIQHVREKELDICLRYQKSILYISIYNTFEEVRRKGKDVYLTTKQDKNQHGIGLSSVRNIVEKYDGQMKIQTQEQKFMVDIILYL